MINEERVKLMTRLALLQQREERNSFEIYRSSRRDYLWRNIMKAIISYSAAAAVVVVLCMLHFLEQPDIWGLEQLLLFVVVALILYIIGAVLFGLLAYMISDTRYEAAMQQIRKYETMLKRLKWMYDREERKGTELKG